MENIRPPRRARVAIRTANGNESQTWQAGNRCRQQKTEDPHEDIGSHTPPHSLGEGHPNCEPWAGLGREGARMRRGEKEKRGSDVRPGIANQRLA